MGVRGRNAVGHLAHDVRGIHGKACSLLGHEYLVERCGRDTPAGENVLSLAFSCQSAFFDPLRPETPRCCRPVECMEAKA